MPITEIFLTALVDTIFGYVLEQSADKLGEKVRNSLGLDPTKRGFKEALVTAFEHLDQQYPQWSADYFDASFFEYEGAPILAQFLVIDGQPDASELATRWADSLNLRSERRAFYTRELEPIALEFLEDLAHELKSKPALRELHGSRALEQSTEALQALRQQIGAEKATYGTRRDYLRWLIGRNLYLDPRGTFQTQRQVQLKLEEIFISLRAQRDETPDLADLHVVEQELAELEVKEASSILTDEETEDRREQLQALLETPLAKSRPAEVLELAQVVTRYDRVIILGDPGSGKTTLLHFLALKHAEALWKGRVVAGADLGAPHFPIYIRIAEYAEDTAWKKKAFSDFLAESCILHDCPRYGLADLLQTELAKGNCLVLLDGLDEIVSADDRIGVVKQIEDFVRHHSDKANRFVITSRKAGYRSAPLAEPFMHYVVQEMDFVQMRRFLEHWCQAVEDAQTSELSLQERRSAAKREFESIIQAVQASPGVLRLAANPLLLRILALIHHTSAQLPQKRIELYKLAADTLSRTWRMAQGVSESVLVKEEYLTPMLSKLAYWLHLHKPTGIATEREVYDVLGEEWAQLNDIHWDADNPQPKILEEVRKFLAAVREHTGLFVERAPRRYGFIHLTFEEYYVARFLVARSRMRAKLIRQHLHQPRWEEPILLALGFLGLEYPAEARELVETAILAQGDEAKELGFTPSNYENLLGRDFLFSLRCLGDNIPVRPRLLKQLIERLVNELLHSTGSARFERYNKALMERLMYLKGIEGADVLIPLLIAALQDANANVNDAAAQSLGQLGHASPEVIAAIVSALHDADVDANVRYYAAHSLGQLKQASPETISALVTALHDVDANVRYYAAQSLGQLSQISAAASTAIVTALHDANATVRDAAAQGLGQLGQASPEAISALVSALHAARANAEIRYYAAQGLGQLGQASPEAVSALVSALHDSNAEVCEYAAQGLGQLKQASPEVIAALVSALHNTNAAVRRAAARSLGQLGQTSPEAISALITALQETSVAIRADAARSLGQLGQASPEAISALVSALNDASAVVRYTTALSMGQLKQATAEVISALVTALHDSDANVRYYAAQSLGQLPQSSPEAISALINTLQDSSIDVHRIAAQSLGQFAQSSSEAISALINALHDSDANVRYYAAQRLGQLPQSSSEAIPALINALQGAEADLSYYAALGLGQLPRPSTKVTTVLNEALLKSNDWVIRRDAARLLGQIGRGETASIDALWDGLLDGDNDVRTASAQALAQLGRQHHFLTKSLENRFVASIQDATFEMVDNIDRPGYDYAYDGLWFLVIGSESEDKQ